MSQNSIVSTESGTLKGADSHIVGANQELQHAPDCRPVAPGVCSCHMDIENESEREARTRKFSSYVYVPPIY